MGAALQESQGHPLGSPEDIKKGSLKGGWRSPRTPGGSSLPEFSRVQRSLGTPGHFPSLTSRHWEVSMVGSLRGAGQGVWAAFPPAAPSRGEAGPSAGIGGPAKWTCKVAGLTRVAIVEFVFQVSGQVLDRLLLHPVGIGIHVVAHEHAEEGYHDHLQEQADDREPPAEISVPDHAAGGAWPGGQRAVRRLEAGQAYKTWGRGGAGRPSRVAEQLIRVPPARSPNRRGDSPCT